MLIHTSRQYILRNLTGSREGDSVSRDIEQQVTEADFCLLQARSLFIRYEGKA